MLWSILKTLVFLAVAAALAFGARWILETPGEVRIAFGSREFFVSPIGFVLGLIVLIAGLALVILKLIGFLGGAGALPARRRDRDQPLLLAQPRAARLRRAVRRHGGAGTRATPSSPMKKAAEGGEAAAPAGPDPAAHRAGGGDERRPRQGARGATRRCWPTTGPAAWRCRA